MKPTTVTSDGLKVWIEFEEQFDDDLALAMAQGATVEGHTGDTWELDYDGLVDLLGIAELERLEAEHAESMSWAEYQMAAAEWAYEGDR